MSLGLATSARDGWQLRSGEQAHRQHPDTFLIPAADVRHGLQRGDLAHLELELRVGVGPSDVFAERVWVMVAEKVGSRYVGLLMQDPQSVRTGDAVYLRAAAEVAFDAEHVLDVQQPPEALVAVVLGEPPTRVWPYR